MPSKCDKVNKTGKKLLKKTEERVGLMSGSPQDPDRWAILYLTNGSLQPLNSSQWKIFSQRAFNEFKKPNSLSEQDKEMLVTVALTDVGCKMMQDTKSCVEYSNGRAKLIFKVNQKGARKHVTMESSDKETEFNMLFHKKPDKVYHLVIPLK